MTWLRPPGFAQITPVANRCAKIQVKSVDTVENPGHEHASAVDNTSGAIVDSRSHLLESGALSRTWLTFWFLEKLLVRVLIVSW
jgi:hypothetical protein